MDELDCPDFEDDCDELELFDELGGGADEFEELLDDDELGGQYDDELDGGGAELDTETAP